MKTILTFIIGLAVVFSTTAQKVENDDMYFTSKDRVKTKTAVTAKPKVQAKRTGGDQAAPVAESEVGINPTDSYSARNVNPEYNSATGDKSGQNGDYFVENYRPTGVNGNLNGNYSGSSSTSAAMYNNSSYAWNTNPYRRYGYSGYSPYMGMGGYPYGGFGMSMSMGTSWGYNPWVYGGMAYSYGNAWSSPWAMYDPFYDPFYSLSCPYSFYGYNSFGSYGYPGYYGYPGSVVVVDGRGATNGRNIAYGRRADRSSQTNYRPDADRQTSETTRTGRAISSGRTRSDNSGSYYERGWRSNLNNSGASTNRSHWSRMNSGNTDSNAPSWNNSGRSYGNTSWGNPENTGGSRSSWTPSVGGGSGGSRSSSTGGGGGGGHTRGRD